MIFVHHELTQGFQRWRLPRASFGKWYYWSWNQRFDRLHQSHPTRCDFKWQFQLSDRQNWRNIHSTWVLFYVLKFKRFSENAHSIKIFSIGSSSSGTKGIGCEARGYPPPQIRLGNSGEILRGRNALIEFVKRILPDRKERKSIDRLGQGETRIGFLLTLK